MDRIQDLMDRADNRMVSSIVHLVFVRNERFDIAVKKILKQNRKGITNDRKEKIIKKSKEELKSLGVNLKETTKKK